MKKNIIEVAPTNDLNIKSLFLLPIKGILFFIRYPKVKKSEPNDLKNTIW
ncbi:MAG: hypothetical protein TRG1_1611 [Flavobacteriaceae bacterium FS1-H7996/R]|nr:MAG: hypothetical protein TRG1_1611 [Flavobacteriaceae bacterium FS1-H7996/R]